jgi:hypothetical protein
MARPSIVNKANAKAAPVKEINTDNALLSIREFVAISGATKFGVTVNRNTDKTFAFLRTAEGTCNMRCDQRIYTTPEGAILRREDDERVSIDELLVVVEGGEIEYSSDEEGRLQINAGIAYTTGGGNGVDLLSML